ncbi:cytochrome c family protein [Cognatishimia sp. MH4019]|uniref:c-type cytochrome n=1 Tax=Cognatishimia sp. MH4019 TaxID=2854030 RepID=UPI001CD4AAAE|nr:c-type cytochrome [Cognatishimia sp. MH4019]
MKLFYGAAIAAMAATPVFAEGHASGDAAAGEEAFNRQCVACHVVVDDNGETLAGRNARTGPNLYAVSGRQLGSVEDFRYSDALVTLGEEQEMVWDEEKFVGYVQDPTGWLRETLDDRRARGKMAFKVRSEEDAANLYAYLASLAPAPEMEGEAEETMNEEAETEEDSTATN